MTHHGFTEASRQDSVKTTHPPERAKTHIEIIDNRINSAVSDLGNCINRLREDNNRKLGNVPEQLKKDTSDPKPPTYSGGIVGQIYAALNMLEGLVTELRSEINRVENL